jgi:uncharacterized protein DUF6894
MPLYYFTLKGGGDAFSDQEGFELPDLAAAREHATAVARELMRHRELPARKWRLEVYDDYLIPCFEILFAEVDETIAHLDPKYRKSLESVARLSALVDDAFSEVRATLSEVRETLAEADRIVSAVSMNGNHSKPRAA